MSTDASSEIERLRRRLQELKSAVQAPDGHLESQRRLDNLLSNLPGLVYRCRNDPDWTMEFLSQGCQSLTGYAAADLLDNRRLSYNDLIHPADRERVWNTVQEAITKKQPFKMTYRIHTAHGKQEWVWEQGSGVWDASGKLEALEGFISNISEQKAAEKALMLTQFTVDRAADAIYWVGKDARFFYANEAACRNLGYSREELLTMRVQDIDPAFPPGGWPIHLKKLRKKGTLTVVSTHVRKDGSRFPVEVSANYIAYDGHEYNCAIIRDISERLLAEEEKRTIQAQLVQAQKMEALGNLAGGVAHDFNNLLTAIRGYSDLALDLNHDDPLLVQTLRRTKAAAIRASNLTRQLLLFSRKQPLQAVPLNINLVVENLLKMLARVIGENVTIVLQLDPDLWTVMADLSSMEQVLMNLALNARDAMSAGGQITVTTHNEDIPPGRVSTGGSRVGRFVCLQISDSGSGMSPEVLERIFEPFFTTKSAMKGTGIGLSVVYGIVREQGGWVEVQSVLGEGSTFKVFLPAVDAVPTARRARKEASATPQGAGQRILLVEDEPGVREFATMALRGHGYEVWEVTSAEEALGLYEAEAGRFDLVFTDVVLPGMGGLELVDELLSAGSGVRFLLTSGYTDQKSRWPSIRERGLRYVQKPYGLKTLLHTIHKALH